MDTKTLLVGQKVYLESGCYGDTGTVVELDVDWRVRHNVIPSGMDVQAEHEGLLRFDDGGTQCEGNGTFECGPWHIDDMPFAERKALIEEAARKFRELNPNFHSYHSLNIVPIIKDSKCNRQD